MLDIRGRVGIKRSSEADPALDPKDQEEELISEQRSGALPTPARYYFELSNLICHQLSSDTD